MEQYRYSVSWKKMRSDNNIAQYNFSTKDIYSYWSYSKYIQYIIKPAAREPYWSN